MALLCKDCEQRFSESEREFANNIFADFHANDRDEFHYGSWLHYFMTSIAWRQLTLDLPGLTAHSKNSRSAVAELEKAEEAMRRYLLGTAGLGGMIRNHAVVLTQCDTEDEALARAKPNVMLRCSAFGYTVLDSRYGYSAILINLAGFVCFLIVKGNPRDTWNGTKVDPCGGRIKQPQHVNSWLMGNLFSYIVENDEKWAAMSPDQRRKVSEAMGKNPGAASLRFLLRDMHLSANEHSER